MVLKLIQVAHDRWRAVNGPHLVALATLGMEAVPPPPQRR
jgi:hypothetical protein